MIQVRDQTIDALRRDREALLEELRNAGAEVKSAGSIKCPFHDDRHASANIHTDTDGVVRFYCHTAGCEFHGDIFDVRARATGRPLADILREAHPMQATKPAEAPAKVFPTIDTLTAGLNVEATYFYTDPDTNKIDLIVIRHLLPDRKKFRQAHPVPGGFSMTAPPKPWPLYNRARVRAAKRVVHVEGEKCVHALHEIGIVATTSPGGAGNAANADYSPLAGKDVVLWPDNDDAGIGYAKTAARMMEALTPRPRLLWIDPASLGLLPGGDVVDFLAALPTTDPAKQREAVEALLAGAEPMGAASELAELIEATIEGRRVSIPFPWAGLSKLTHALLPGRVTVLCGSAGMGKSLLLLQAAAYWYTAGYKVAFFALEDDRADHLNRILAQAEGCAELLDDAYVRQCPQEARNAFAKHRELLDGLGACITTVDAGRPPTLVDLAKWIESRAKAGAEIIIIDPVTLAEVGREQWLDDAKFMASAKTAIRSTGARLILATHPRKGSKMAVGLDEVAGGASYVRAAHTVLSLVRMDVPKDLRVSTPLGTKPETVGHYLWIGKARYGRGSGLRLAFKFDPATMRFWELGVIEKGAPAEVNNAE